MNNKISYIEYKNGRKFEFSIIEKNFLNKIINMINLLEETRKLEIIEFLQLYLKEIKKEISRKKMKDVIQSSFSVKVEASPL